MQNKVQPLNRKAASAMWVDPDSKATGVLLSDRIQLYVQKVALLEPFQEKNLGPASYDLTLGNDCWYSDHTAETGELKRALQPGEHLVIQPNSIVFVSSAEILNLPFYLTARFNLKLRFLHEGLLVGTGPQVDPGFSGKLSCPLHNISSEKICLTCGETFAVIEFQKTTPFAQGENWTDAISIATVRSRGELKELKGVHEFPCLTFPSRSLNRAPVKGYLPPGKSVSSSVQGVVNKLGLINEKVETKLSEFDKWLGRINIGVFLTLLGVAVTLATYFYATVNWHKNAYDAALRAEEQTKQLKLQLDQLQTRYDELTHSFVAPTNTPLVESIRKATGTTNQIP